MKVQVQVEGIFLKILPLGMMGELREEREIGYPGDEH